MPIDTERYRLKPWNAATILMMIMGCGVLAYIAWHSYQTAAFLHHASRVTGVVIDQAGHSTIRFITGDSMPVEFVQSGFISRSRGAVVPVAYDPRNPAMTAQVATFWASWGKSLWLLPMGLGFTLLPLFGVRAQFRPGRY
jgi:hypothetical protein